jgi:hypothetical protein
VEKGDLAALVRNAFPTLPLSVRAHLGALVAAPTRAVAPVDSGQALAARVARLRPDEQYSVQVFQVCSRPGRG